METLRFSDEIKGAKKKKMHGESSSADSITVYLIGKLGKSDHYENEIDLKIILDYCYDLIKRSYEVIGGRFILIECYEEKLKNYYEKFDFKFLQKSDNGKRFCLVKKIID